MNMKFEPGRTLFHSHQIIESLSSVGITGCISKEKFSTKKLITTH